MSMIVYVLLLTFVMTGSVLTGVASWYGPGFHGRLTASGEVFDMHAMTAAHRKLPLGTMVSIRNMLNGKTVVVTINDRGPYIDGRMLDVSYGVAVKLDMVDRGFCPVQVKVMRLQ